MPFDTVFSWIIKKRIDQIEQFTNNPIEAQKTVWDSLLVNAKNTEFGIKHGFSSISSYRDFKNNIPLRTYEDLFPFIEKSIQGQENILWPGKTSWFSKSSGTTNAKSKLIPVTQEAIQDCHYKGGKDLLSIYYHNNPGAKLFSGKHLILGGNTSVNKLNENSYFGDLSAIIVKNLPFWAEIRRTPNRQITLMENWEEKILKMAEASLKEDVKIIAGVPSWMMVLLNKITEVSGGKSFKEIWPNLEFYMHGGVNFEPYRNQFDSLLADNTVNYYQTYNASEGFFSLQNENNSDDMLLMLDYGIFYEFIPMDKFDGTNSDTIGLTDVELGKNYALVISTNGGLWRYLLGDTVKFTSLNPFKIKVTGRTKHFINAFGEELIIENTDQAITEACLKTNSNFVEYSVAPIYLEGKEKGAHQWAIEFSKAPEDIEEFKLILDNKLKTLNSDYEAKRSLNMILKAPKLEIIPKDGFKKWLSKKGKLGGQNKIVRLKNDRDFMDELLGMI
ncbi:MAG: GH3 auxin-responsive promoter family protein [Flavobacteriales bacterium]